LLVSEEFGVLEIDLADGISREYFQGVHYDLSV